MEPVIVFAIAFLVGLAAGLIQRNRKLIRVVKEQNKIIKILQSDAPIFHSLQLKYSEK